MISELQNLAFAVAVGFVFFVFPVFGQQDSIIDHPERYAELVRREFGLDQRLVNGVRYHRLYKVNDIHPYFLQEEFMPGSLILNDYVYENLSLNYDIYSQIVELEYPNLFGGNNRISTVTDFVDGFSFGDIIFEKLAFENAQPRFYQVIRTNCFTCYIFYEKALDSSKEGGGYSGAKRTLFLALNDVIEEFKSKQGFSDFFPDEYQKEIRRLLRQGSITFRSSSAEDIILNLNAVCNLMEEKQAL